MNFAKNKSRQSVAVVVCVFVFVVFAVLLTGCSEPFDLSTEEELAAFKAAGPIQPEIDVNRLLSAKQKPIKYHICQEDLLEILMPSALIRTAMADNRPTAELTYRHLSRVDASGMVTLPIVGSIKAEGLTLSELEASIGHSYYPKYTTEKPSIVIRVAEFDTLRVTVTGAVNSPGLYEMPRDKMTLVSAIMAAGGIVETGAGAIRVHYPHEEEATESHSAEPVESLSKDNIKLTFQQRTETGLGALMIKKDDRLLYAEDLDVTDEDQRRETVTRVSKSHPEIPVEFVLYKLCELAEVIKPGSGKLDSLKNDEYNRMLESLETDLQVEHYTTNNKPLYLPVKGLNIPFSDIALRNGAQIEVEAYDPEVFFVIGLVAKPVVVPYPKNTTYNLTQALAFSGGIDPIADPHYVRVYREDENGRVVDATFEMHKGRFLSNSDMLIKPGDVISVESTARTRRNQVLAEMLQLRFGITGAYTFND